MATVVITDEVELQAFLASGKKDDRPVVADPELGELFWVDSKGGWCRMWSKEGAAAPSPSRFFPMDFAPRPMVDGVHLSFDGGADLSETARIPADPAGPGSEKNPIKIAGPAGGAVIPASGGVPPLVRPPCPRGEIPVVFTPGLGVHNLNGGLIYFEALTEVTSFPLSFLLEAQAGLVADPTGPGSEKNPIKIAGPSARRVHGVSAVPSLATVPRYLAGLSTGDKQTVSENTAKHPDTVPTRDEAAKSATGGGSAMDEVAGVSAETYERAVRGLPVPGLLEPDPRTGFRDDPAYPGLRVLDVTRPPYVRRTLSWERDPRGGPRGGPRGSPDGGLTAFRLRADDREGRTTALSYRLDDRETAVVDPRFLAERVLREFRGELTADVAGRMLADAYPDLAPALLDGRWKEYARGYDRGRAEAAGEARQEERRSVADALYLWATGNGHLMTGASAARMLASILRDHDDRRDGPLERRLGQRARHGGRPADFPVGRRGETAEGLRGPGDPGRKADLFDPDDDPAKR